MYVSEVQDLGFGNTRFCQIHDDDDDDDDEDTYISFRFIHYHTWQTPMQQITGKKKLQNTKKRPMTTLKAMLTLLNVAPSKKLFSY